MNKQIKFSNFDHNFYQPLKKMVYIFKWTQNFQVFFLIKKKKCWAIYLLLKSVFSTLSQLYGFFSK